MQAMIQNILNLDVRRRPVYMVPNFLMGITVVFTAESNLTDNLIGKKLAPGVLKYIPILPRSQEGISFSGFPSTKTSPLNSPS